VFVTCTSIFFLSPSIANFVAKSQFYCQFYNIFTFIGYWLVEWKKWVLKEKKQFRDIWCHARALTANRALPDKPYWWCSSNLSYFLIRRSFKKKKKKRKKGHSVDNKKTKQWQTIFSRRWFVEDIVSLFRNWVWRSFFSQFNKQYKDSGI